MLKRRDIAAGDFTYGERIELARILREEDRDDIERIKDIIECLHDKRPNNFEAVANAAYAKKVSEDFVEWLKKEHVACYVEPQPEALQAGVEKMAEEVGEIGGVVDMAERFGFTFEQVYKMPYLNVFAIWRVDAARARFERRLNKVYEQKSKSRHG